MKIRIQVAIDAENGDGEKVEDIVQLERGALRPEELGLTLAEAKAILHGTQQSLVTKQVAAYLTQFKICPESYGLSVKLLSDVLPIADEINPTSVRRHLHRVAERIE
jgi:hypothetical protein